MRIRHWLDKWAARFFYQRRRLKNSNRHWRRRHTPLSAEGLEPRHLLSGVSFVADDLESDSALVAQATPTPADSVVEVASIDSASVVVTNDTTSATADVAAAYPGKTAGEYRNAGAFAAVREDGSVVCWGNNRYGGDSSSVAVQLAGGVREVFSNRYAFAAVREDGSVVAWGHPQLGGDLGDAADALSGGVKRIYSTFSAFASVKNDGSVVTWGNANAGGDSSAVAEELADGVVKIYSNRSAFAALKHDGSVVTWGGAAYGGDSSGVAADLQNVAEISATAFAFAALKQDGSVIAWGDANSGAAPPADLGPVEQLFANQYAFAALGTDGTVTAWGHADFGGDAPDDLVEVADIVASDRAFAAVMADGSVRCWGAADAGGSGPGDLVAVEQVYATKRAFAAVMIDGSVRSWGHSLFGGQSDQVAAELAGGVTTIVANDLAFAALKQDGSVVTWGSAMHGGESDGAGLDGEVADLFVSGGAFAAVMTDGSVRSWGRATSGGDSSNVSDQLAGGVAGMADPTTEVLDTLPPVITLVDDAEARIEASRTEDYVDAGATATDLIDGNLNHAVVVSGDVVDMRVPGTYIIQYNCEDLSGNEADEVTRKVIVEDTTCPEVTLVGENSISVEAGFPYTDAGATAEDSLDGDLTEEIEKTVTYTDENGDEIEIEEVETQYPRLYKVRYDVEDAAGNVADTWVRTVTVQDTLPPIISLHYVDQVIVDQVLQVSDQTDTGLGDEANAPAGLPSETELNAVGSAFRLNAPIIGQTPYTQPDGTPVESRQEWIARTAAAGGATELPTATAWEMVDIDVVATTTLRQIDDDGSAVDTVVSEIDFTRRGTYLFEYDAHDESGNYAESIVFGLMLNDTTAPDISITGGQSETVEAGSDWTLPEATAFDNLDGDLTADILYTVENVSAGTLLGSDLTHAAAAALLDPLVPGEYLVTMAVSDAAGIYGHNNSNNAGVAHKAITIQDTLPPVMLTAGNIASVEVESYSWIQTPDPGGPVATATGATVTLLGELAGAGLSATTDLSLYDDDEDDFIDGFLLETLTLTFADGQVWDYGADPSSPLLRVGDLGVTLENLSFRPELSGSDGNAIGNISLTLGSVELYPEGDAAFSATVEDASGWIDPATGEVSLVLGELIASLGPSLENGSSVIQVHVDNATFKLDDVDTTDILTVDQATLALEEESGVLDGIKFDIENFRFNVVDGEARFGVGAVSVSAEEGVHGTLGLAEFLPLNVTDATLAFDTQDADGYTDFTQFDLTAHVQVDTAGLEVQLNNLLGTSDLAITVQQYDDEDSILTPLPEDGITVGIAVDDGGVRLLAVPGLQLGVENFVLALPGDGNQLAFGGTLTLPALDAEGDVVAPPNGLVPEDLQDPQSPPQVVLDLTAEANNGALGGWLAVAGSLTPRPHPTNETTLMSLAGVATITGAGNLEGLGVSGSGTATADFAWDVVATPQTDGTLALSGAPQLGALTFEEIVLEVEGLVRLTIPRANISSEEDDAGEPVVTATGATVTLLGELAGAGLSATTDLSLYDDDEDDFIDGFLLETLTLTFADGQVWDYGADPSSPLLRVGDLGVTLENLSFRPEFPESDGNAIGTIKLSLGSVELYPEGGAAFSATVIGANGWIDPATGEVSLDLGELTAGLGPIAESGSRLLRVDVDNATFKLDDDEATDILEVQNATLTLGEWSVWDDVTFSVTGFKFNVSDSGVPKFSFGSIKAETTETEEGFLTKLGLAGILPFDVTLGEIAFIEPDNDSYVELADLTLENLSFTVGGTFDLTTLEEAAGFKPTVTIGAEENTFQGTFVFKDGFFVPEDLQQIKVGIENWDLGQLTFAGEITLGSADNPLYSAGVLQLEGGGGNLSLRPNEFFNPDSDQNFGLEEVTVGLEYDDGSQTTTLSIGGGVFIDTDTELKLGNLLTLERGDADHVLEFNFSVDLEAKDGWVDRLTKPPINPPSLDEEVVVTPSFDNAMVGQITVNLVNLEGEEGEEGEGFTLFAKEVNLNLNANWDNGEKLLTGDFGFTWGSLGIGGQIEDLSFTTHGKPLFKDVEAFEVEFDESESGESSPLHKLWGEDKVQLMPLMVEKIGIEPKDDRFWGEDADGNTTIQDPTAVILVTSGKVKSPDWLFPLLDDDGNENDSNGEQRGGVGGNLEATEAEELPPVQFKMVGTFNDLEIDLEKLLDPGTGLPIVHIESLGAEAELSLGEKFAIDGVASVGKVDGNPESEEDDITDDVYFVSIGGNLKVGDYGGGGVMALTTAGPLGVTVSVPLAIALGNTGFVISGAAGTIQFGTLQLPDEINIPADLAEIINPFDIDLTTPGGIEDIVQDLWDDDKVTPTWESSMTLALQGELTHVAVPGLLTAAVTVAAAIDWPGDPSENDTEVDTDGLAFMGFAELSTYGFTLAEATLMLDLREEMNPTFGAYIVGPADESFLGMIFPFQADIGVVLKTDGVAMATAIGLQTLISELIDPESPDDDLIQGEALFESAAAEMLELIDASRGDSYQMLRGPNQTIYPGKTAGEFRNGSAFAAIRADGSVVTWGDANAGGDSSTVADPLSGGVKDVFSNRYAFAALKEDGSVVAWGDPQFGGELGEVSDELEGGRDWTGSTDYVQRIYSTYGAFAALKADGSVVTWGPAEFGGNSDDVAVVLRENKGVKRIYSNHYAFAALKKSGSVVTWGDPSYGGQSSAGSGLNNVQDIAATAGAFAALKEDGSVVAWGHAEHGGTAPEGLGEVDRLYANEYAFTALRSDGTVTSWGQADFGGTAPLEMTDVLQIVASDRAFAALMADGSVKTWGPAEFGGTAPEGLSGATKLFATKQAFAATLEDGSVVTWGDNLFSGQSDSVAGDLAGGVTRIYANDQAFAALKENGSVVTWGNSLHGGDSSGTAGLDGGVVHLVASGGAFAALHGDGSVVSWGSDGDSSSVADLLAEGVVDLADPNADNEEEESVTAYQSAVARLLGPSDEFAHWRTFLNRLRNELEFGDILDKLGANEELDADETAHLKRVLDWQGAILNDLIAASESFVLKYLNQPDIPSDTVALLAELGMPVDTTSGSYTLDPRDFVQKFSDAALDEHYYAGAFLGAARNVSLEIVSNYTHVLFENLSGAVNAALNETHAFVTSDAFDPRLLVQGELGPNFLGVPVGDSPGSVQMTISKDGISFGGEISVLRTAKLLAGAGVGVGVGVLAGSSAWSGWGTTVGVAAGMAAGACYYVPYLIESLTGDAELFDLTLAFEFPLDPALALPDLAAGNPPFAALTPFSPDWGMLAHASGGAFGFGGSTSMAFFGEKSPMLENNVQIVSDFDQGVEIDRIPVSHKDLRERMYEHGGLLLTQNAIQAKLVTDPFEVIRTIIEEGEALGHALDETESKMEYLMTLFGDGTQFLEVAQAAIQETEEFGRAQAYLPILYKTLLPDDVQEVMDGDPQTLNETYRDTFYQVEGEGDDAVWTLRDDVFDAMVEKLADQVNEVDSEFREQMFIEGLVNGKLFGTELVQGRIFSGKLPDPEFLPDPEDPDAPAVMKDFGTSALTVTGAIPWLGNLAVEIQLDQQLIELPAVPESGEDPAANVRATFGDTVKLPRGYIEATLDTSQQQDREDFGFVMKALGRIPPEDSAEPTLFTLPEVGGAENGENNTVVTLRGYTPGYDFGSDEPIKRIGGLELDAHLNIPGVVENANFVFQLTPPTGIHIPFSATASVEAITLGGFEITGAELELISDASGLRLSVSGATTILGATFTVDGTLNSQLQGDLTLELESGTPGFDVIGVETQSTEHGFTLTLHLDGPLQGALAFDGYLVGMPGLPADDAVEPARLHATGNIYANGAFHVSGSADNFNLTGFIVDADVTVANYDIEEVDLDPGSLVPGIEQNAWNPLDVRVYFDGSLADPLLGASFTAKGDLSTSGTGELALALKTAPLSHTESFGSGENAFAIEFVTVGDPGNPDDVAAGTTPAAGGIDYTYSIGKHEISRAMVEKANAEAGLNISLWTGAPYGNQPATGISWYEAAQFVNYLNTSQGHAAAYKFDADGNFQLWQAGDAGYDPNNLFRNSQAVYVLPTLDEWYKAAYYDADHGGLEVGGYWNYPTGSDSAPLGVGSGTDPGTAVFGSGNSGPANVTQAGGLSPYGTMGQGGNVWEWEETAWDLVNDEPGIDEWRGAWGGRWSYWAANGTNASARSNDHPELLYKPAMGFRVACRPEFADNLLPPSFGGLEVEGEFRLVMESPTAGSVSFDGSVSGVPGMEEANLDVAGNIHSNGEFRVSGAFDKMSFAGFAVDASVTVANYDIFAEDDLLPGELQLVEPPIVRVYFDGSLSDELLGASFTAVGDLATDGTGRLKLTLTSTSGTPSFPFWNQSPSSGSLLANAGFENELNNWNTTATNGVGATIRTSNPAPQEGSGYVYGNQTPHFTIWQDVKLSDHGIPSAVIDTETLTAAFGGWQAGWGDNDAGKISIRFLDEAMQELGRNELPLFTSNKTWVEQSGESPIPVGTRTIRYHFEGIISEDVSWAGHNTDAYLDAAYLRVLPSLPIPGFDVDTGANFTFELDLETPGSGSVNFTGSISDVPGMGSAALSTSGWIKSDGTFDVTSSAEGLGLDFVGFGVNEATVRVENITAPGVTRVYFGGNADLLGANFGVEGDLGTDGTGSLALDLTSDTLSFGSFEVDTEAALEIELQVGKTDLGLPTAQVYFNGGISNLPAEILPLGVERLTFDGLVQSNGGFALTANAQKLQIAQFGTALNGVHWAEIDGTFTLNSADGGWIGGTITGAKVIQKIGASKTTIYELPDIQHFKLYSDGKVEVESKDYAFDVGLLEFGAKTVSLLNDPTNSIFRLDITEPYAKVTDLFGSEKNWTFSDFDLDLSGPAGFDKSIFSGDPLSLLGFKITPPEVTSPEITSPQIDLVRTGNTLGLHLSGKMDFAGNTFTVEGDIESSGEANLTMALKDEGAAPSLGGFPLNAGASFALQISPPVAPATLPTAQVHVTGEMGFAGTTFTLDGYIQSSGEANLTMTLIGNDVPSLGGFEIDADASFELQISPGTLPTAVVHVNGEMGFAGTTFTLDGYIQSSGQSILTMTLKDEGAAPSLGGFPLNAEASFALQISPPVAPATLPTAQVHVTGEMDFAGNTFTVEGDIESSGEANLTMALKDEGAAPSLGGFPLNAGASFALQISPPVAPATLPTAQVHVTGEMGFAGTTFTLDGYIQSSGESILAMTLIGNDVPSLGGFEASGSFRLIVGGGEAHVDFDGAIENIPGIESLSFAGDIASDLTFAFYHTVENLTIAPFGTEAGDLWVELSGQLTLSGSVTGGVTLAPTSTVDVAVRKGARSASSSSLSMLAGGNDDPADPPDIEPPNDPPSNPDLLYDLPSLSHFSILPDGTVSFEKSFDDSPFDLGDFGIFSLSAAKLAFLVQPPIPDDPQTVVDDSKDGSFQLTVDSPSLTVTNPFGNNDWTLTGNGVTINLRNEDFIFSASEAISNLSDQLIDFFGAFGPQSTPVSTMDFQLSTHSSGWALELVTDNGYPQLEQPHGNGYAELKEFRIDSAGTITGKVRADLTVEAGGQYYTLARGDFQLEYDGSILKMRVPSLSTDLGFVTANMSGWIKSDGTFFLVVDEIDVTENIDFTAGPMGFPDVGRISGSFYAYLSSSSGFYASLTGAELQYKFWNGSDWVWITLPGPATFEIGQGSSWTFGLYTFQDG